MRAMEASELPFRARSEGEHLLLASVWIEWLDRLTFHTGGGETISLKVRSRRPTTDV